MDRQTQLDLVTIFKIPRSTGVVMQDNKIITDGHTWDDLSVINPETMKAYLGIKDAGAPFDDLFAMVLERMYAKPVAKSIKIEDIKHEEPVKIKRPRGRPRKNK